MPCRALCRDCTCAGAVALFNFISHSLGSFWCTSRHPRACAAHFSLSVLTPCRTQSGSPAACSHTQYVALQTLKDGSEPHTSQQAAASKVLPSAL